MNDRLTRDDARAQVNLGLVGSLVSGPYGDELTRENLDYLLALRDNVRGWLDGIEEEIRRVEALPRSIPAGTRIKVKPTASGLTRVYPAANWLRDTVTVVTLLDEAPNEDSLDVLDVQTKDGIRPIYDFNIIGRA